MSTYVPKAGSIAERICTFFRENPDEELTRRDIADKFGCQASGVDGILAGAIAAGVVATRNNEELVRVWCAGADRTTHPSSAATKRTGIKRAPLPELDVEQLAVRTDVPLPLPRSKGATRYDPIFDKLTKVGTSLLLPRRYAPAIAKALQSYQKRTNRQFKVRNVDAEQCGVWRTA